MSKNEEKEIDYINRKFRLYDKLYKICWIIWLIIIFLFFGSGKNKEIIYTVSIIFAIIFYPVLISQLIFNSKRKKYKNIAYDLYIHESAINDTFIKHKKNQKLDNQTNIESSTKYHIKAKTITENEKYFLDIIKKHFGKDYDIRVQVPLSSIIEKDKDFNGQYQSELNRVIDIGIFDKDTSYPLLLIEINDNTHHRKDRQIRDAKVKNICEQANIKLIAFWTEYSNTEKYVFNRVNENLGR